MLQRNFSLQKVHHQFEFVLFFENLSKNSEGVENKALFLSLFLTPFADPRAYTFLRIPLSKNSHGSALLWFRPPLLKPEKIPRSRLPCDSFESGEEKKKKKEERTTAGLLLYQAAPLKAPPLEIRSWRTIGFSCLLLPLLHCLRSFSRLQNINSNGKRIKLCPISPVRLSLLLCSGRRVKDISFDYSGERAKRLFLFLFVVYISNITSSFPRVRRSSLCPSAIPSSSEWDSRWEISMRYGGGPCFREISK